MSLILDYRKSQIPIQEPIAQVPTLVFPDVLPYEIVLRSKLPVSLDWTQAKTPTSRAALNPRPQTPNPQVAGSWPPAASGGDRPIRRAVVKGRAAVAGSRSLA